MPGPPTPKIPRVWDYAIDKDHSVDITRAAFLDAVNKFSQQLTQDECQKIWLKDKNTMQEVLQAVQDAKMKYGESKRSRPRKWLERFSARVTCYGNILDVLVQQSPECVSLVWGTMKFFFTAVTNHEELVAQLSKALCRIGDALPHVEIKSALYSSEHMKRTVSVLYALLIKFFKRAIDWYSEGRLKHAIHSITRPYALRFEDIVNEIKIACQNIDGVAATSSQLELRDVHTLLRRVEALILEHQKINVENYRISFAVNEETLQRVREMQFSQLLEASASNSAGFLTPEQSLQSHQAMRNRRRRLQRKIFEENTAYWYSHELQTWAVTQQSSMLIVNASLSNRDQIRDFATSIIETIKQNRIPVIWALRGHDATSEGLRSLVLLKQLVMQVLQINKTLEREIDPRINAARLQCATTESEWFDILTALLHGTHQVFIVIDTHALGEEDGRESTWIASFQRLFRGLQASCANTVVRVLFVNYRSPSSRRDSREQVPQVRLDRRQVPRPRPRLNQGKLLQRLRVET